MAEAINFKKINSPKYKAWRILSAPNGWGEIYRLRELRFGNSAGAIIFPEQLLGLKSKVYTVGGSRASGAASTHIKVWSPILSAPTELIEFKVDSELVTCEEVYEWERQRAGICMRIKGISDMSFADDDLAIFTNARDALKYQAALMASMVSQIG